MASARKSENQSRIAAANDARDAILERAEKDSARMMSGLLANPKLVFQLKDFDKLITALLKKGFKNELAQLSKNYQVGKMQRSQLRIALAAAGFAELCAANDSDTSAITTGPYSAARTAAEAAFSQLCA